jgi:hypothetical protein
MEAKAQCGKGKGVAEAQSGHGRYVDPGDWRTS